MTKGVQALLTTLNGRPERLGGRKCCGLLGFAFTFPFICTLTLSRGESGGLASGGVSLPFRLPLPLPLPFPLPFPLPLGGGGGSRRHNQRASHQEGLGECGYVIPPGGEVVRLRRERACCPRGLAQARGRREEGGHPEMVVVSGSCCNS